MPDYRRPGIAGDTYFITQVTYQRRFWEHLIRDETNFAHHCDYIHYNPVHHQLCQVPTEWQFSSVHRLITEGIYPPNGVNAQLSLGWMSDGSDGAFACRNAPYKIRDRTIISSRAKSWNQLCQTLIKLKRQFFHYHPMSLRN